MPITEECISRNIRKMQPLRKGKWHKIISDNNIFFILRYSTCQHMISLSLWQRLVCTLLRENTPVKGLHWPLLGADALACHLGLAVVHTAVPYSDELEAGRNEMLLPTRIFIGNTARGLDSKYWTSFCFKFVEQLLKLCQRNHHVILTS